MTVLRSREVSSAVTSKVSQPPPTEDGILEPVTPLKNFELLTQSSNSITPSSSCAVSMESGLGCGSGSVMVVESGSQRRRSARLASKVVGGDDGSVERVSGRRKRKVEDGLDGAFDARNLGGERGLDVDPGVESLGWVIEMSVNVGNLQDLEDRDMIQLGTDMDGVRNGASATELRLDCDAKTSGLETVNNGRHKRKVNMDTKSLGFESHGKGFLSLRSGKRVVKGELKDLSSACDGMEDIENSKRTCTVLGRDDLSETSSEASMEELDNGKLRDSGFSTEEKAKGKVSSESMVASGSVLVNPELGDKDGSCCDDMNLPKSTDSKVLIKDTGSAVSETGVKTRGRTSKEEKGTMKLGVMDSSPLGSNRAEPKLKNIDGSSSSGTSQPAANEPLQDGVQGRERDAAANDARSAYMDRFRRVARQNAYRFAHFSARQELGNDSPDGRDTQLHKTNDEIEDWPGPFSTAMKIIRDRETNKQGEQRGSSSNKRKAVELKWIPTKQESGKHQKQAPSLQELCLSILSKNANAISSLDFVPDVLRHKICWSLCDSRKMDGHFLKLLVQGSPTEIRVRDCSWLSEELFTKTFEGCDAGKLMVLQLDQCGNCMPDYILYGTLARSPNNLPALTTISLKGAYRLSDTGLSKLVSSAPSLKSINISQCPLLTAEGICALANSLRSILRELYLDECQGIDAMLMLPVLLDLENLEVLSVAGIQTICDDFVSTFILAHGCRIKELGLADCMELTDFSMEVIGDNCSELHAIDLRNLCKLTDVSLAYLANGCLGIHRLKLCRNEFSDEAIAAYLDLRGAFLNNLSLNNVVQVSSHTALSLARNCRNLRNLDLSWCRNITNEALGLIVDSCLSLELLKLFGCTQVTKVFLDGHSNPQVKIVGLKMTPVLKHIDVPDFLAGPLKYSSSH